MIINYDEHSKSRFYQPASYNTTLLNHYNHDVYDKKTVCIDLTTEINLNNDQNYEYYDSKNPTNECKTSLEFMIKLENNMMGKKQPTYSFLSSHPQSYSCKKTKTILTNNQDENSNKLNDNRATKMKKTQLNQNDVILFEPTGSGNSSCLHQQHKKHADISNTNKIMRQQLNELNQSRFHHLNTNDTISNKYDLNYNSFINFDNNKTLLNCLSSSLYNLYEHNNNFANFDTSAHHIANNFNIISKSTVDNNKTKKICLEAIKTSQQQQQQNFCHSFQTNQGMHDKDKHLIAKSVSSTNNNLCNNCDYFSNLKKGHDDLAINDYSNTKLISRNNHYMSSISSASSTSSLNSIHEKFTIKDKSNDMMHDSSNLEHYIPFKKRVLQQPHQLHNCSTVDTSFKAQPSDIYLQTSDYNNTSFNFSKKVLSQSNSSLNRQSKPVLNNSCLYSNSNFNKKSNSLNLNTINTYSTGLTLPITIINKSADNKTTTNKLTTTSILTTALISNLPNTTTGSSTTISGNSRKEWPTTIVPFKKRNFSSFLEDQSECSISSQSSTTTQVSSTNSTSASSTNLLITTDQKQSLAKKSKEHLLDPNRQKKIKRCPHVWQFCADLLASDNYNPSIIKWLNKDRGIFKIVKPDKVAELWGAQKNRRSDKKMNYEKMARGMRYSRREGFFKKLDKEKNKPNEYGKQLVFQFSEKVVKNFVNFDWKWSFSK